MAEIICKRCHGTDYVKRGTVRNLQRYQCKACGCNFTNTPPRGKPPGMKALAVMLYAMGNMSFCSIARVLGVSDVAVLKWVRDEARRLPEPAVTAETVIITLDEMWHFLKKRLASSGFGARMTLSPAAPSPGCLVAVMMPPVNSSLILIKSASRVRPFSPTIGQVSTASSPKTSSSPART
jgi:transposase-like protein